ncbi:MAG TPA: CHASE2 domain-containing protein [Spirochaetota bacterium]|nr:CHASE2 domain-containing protein [Spirochaetota bacterium]HOL57976.1 CHASE2 domain-containing protein [Spirochaetota bacterium]
MKKIELKYLKSEFIVEFIVSIIAGLSGFIWAIIFSSEIALLDSRLNVRKFVIERIEKIIDKESTFIGNDKFKDKNIIVIEIPQNVLEKYGNPEITPRDYLADLINIVSSFGPKVIALDYNFDRFSINPENDKKLKNTFENAKNVVFAYTQYITMKGYSLAITDALKYFSESVYSLGYSNVTKVEDKNKNWDVARFINFTMKSGTEPSLSHEILCCYYGLPKGIITDEEIINDAERQKLFLEKSNINERIYKYGTLINYKKDLKDLFTIYTSEQVLLMGDFLSENFKDKIVIIGDGGYNRDLHTTPFSEKENDTYGVLIQAQIVKNFLERDFIYKTPIFLNIFLLIIICLITFFISYNFDFLKSSILTISLFISYILFSYIIFILFGIWIPIILICGGILFVWIVITILRITYSEKNNIDMETLLVKNIPPQTLSECENIETIDIFNDRKADSFYLICILNDFNEIKDNSSKKYSEIINYYYTTMKRLIFDHNGNFNMWLNNSFMAFWNTPIENKAKEKDVIDTAFEIIFTLSIINGKGKILLKDFKEFSLNIFVGRGNFISGYYGYEDQKIFTITNNELFSSLSVLLSHRLKSNEIIIEEEITHYLPKNIFSFEEINVKNKKYFKLKKI